MKSAHSINTEWKLLKCTEIKHGSVMLTADSKGIVLNDHAMTRKHDAAHRCQINCSEGNWFLNINAHDCPAATRCRSCCIRISTSV